MNRTMSALTNTVQPVTDLPKVVHSELEHYVIFALDDRRFALPLENVKRILRMVKITPVPNAPLALAGIINLAGQTTPVLDLRACVGFPLRPAALSDHLLILETKTTGPKAIRIAKRRKTDQPKASQRKASQPEDSLPNPEPATQTFAVWVDEVLKVVSLQPGQAGAPPASIQACFSAIPVEAILREQPDLIQVLDLFRLVQDPQDGKPGLNELLQAAGLS